LSIEESEVIQQGQVFKLKARGADGRPLWAFRYRLDGRGSARPQVGGFASRTEADEALQKALAHLRPGGCAATMTLDDLVEEYLGMHQAEPVTIAKLRWLLGKATSTLGPVRLADLSAKEIYAWRQTIPEGHRFEATQALRQVLRRAVDVDRRAGVVYVRRAFANGRLKHTKTRRAACRACSWCAGSARGRRGACWRGS
jgi:hypothetical protein